MRKEGERGRRWNMEMREKRGRRRGKEERGRGGRWKKGRNTRVRGGSGRKRRRGIRRSGRRVSGLVRWDCVLPNVFTILVISNCCGAIHGLV